MDIDPKRLAFLQGVLAAFASNGQVVHYDEVRRLCRLNRELIGEYLGEARRQMLAEGQPDYCAIVVRSKGIPGDGWSTASDSTPWPTALRRAHTFWRDRRAMDNEAFAAKHGDLPKEPGLG